MVTAESLRERYTATATEDLLEIYANKADYTEMAVSIVEEELEKRKVPREEIVNYQSVIPRGNSELTLTNYLVDLMLWQKVVFFVLWIPKIRKYFTTNFLPAGYILRMHQSNYYSIVGFIVFVISAGLGRYDITRFFISLIAGFLLTYAFDIGYNRTRQRDNLTNMVSKGETLGW